jgi:hypothetical protein
MRRLQNIDRARVAQFVAAEQKEAPDWFLSDTAENFASPADIVLYFSAFCVGLSHLNSALGEIDAILKRIKEIMSDWKGIAESKDERSPEGRTLRLKSDEKLLIHIYRAACAGEGGLSGHDAAVALKTTDAEAEALLVTLQGEGLITKSKRADRWRLVVQ